MYPQIFSISRNVQIKCLLIMGFYIHRLQLWEGIECGRIQVAKPVVPWRPL